MAAEAAVSIGIAAAAIDFYKFSISLAKTVRQIHKALDGLPEDLEECVRSLNAFERLVTRLDRSLQSTDASGPMTEAESDLKYFIDLCRKAGEELDVLLQGVLPNPSRVQRRWRDDVQTGLRLLRKRGAFDRIIQKVHGYKSELGLLLMERSLTHRATNTASALAHVLDNEERNTQTQRLLLERLGANEAALGDLVQLFSEARNDFARRQLRNDTALDTLQTILQLANEQQLNPRHIYISFPQFNMSPAAWWYQFCHQTGSRIATATQTLRGVSKLRLQQLVQFKHQSDVRIRKADRASQRKQILLVAMKGHSRVERLTLRGSESNVEFAQLLKAYSRNHATWSDWLTLQRPARLHFVKYSKKSVEPNSEYSRLRIEVNDMLPRFASSICGLEHPEITFQLGNSRLVDNLLANDLRLPGFHGSGIDVRLTHGAKRAGQARLDKVYAGISFSDYKPQNIGGCSMGQVQEETMDHIHSFASERQILELMSGDIYQPFNEPNTEDEIRHSASESTSLVPGFRALLHGLEEYDFADVDAENHPDRHYLRTVRHIQMLRLRALCDPAESPSIVPYLETLNRKPSRHQTGKDSGITEKWGIEVETGFDWGLFWWLVLLIAAVLLQYLIHSWKQYIPRLVNTFGPLRVLCKAQRSSEANNGAVPAALQGSLHSPALGTTIAVYSAIQASPWYGSTIFWCVTTTAVLWNLFYLCLIWRRFKIEFKISIRPPTLQLRVYKDSESASRSGDPDAAHLERVRWKQVDAETLAVVSVMQWCFWSISPIIWLVAKLSEGRVFENLSREHCAWTCRTPKKLASILRPAAMFTRLQTSLKLCIGCILVAVDAIAAAHVISFLRFMYRALPYYLGVIVFIQSGFIFTKLIEDTVGQLTPLCVLQVLGLGFIPHLRIVLRVVVLNASFFSLLRTTDGQHLHSGRFMLTVLLVGASVASFRW